MRGLVTTLITLVVLLVAADRAAWWLAERGVATAIRQSEGLDRQPEVSIGGIPFLTQAFRGRYERVDVRFLDVPAEEGLRLDELDARLRGVRVPLRDVVDRTVERTPVDQADATAQVGFAALNAAAASRIPSEQLTVRFSAGSRDDRVALDGEYQGPLGAVRLKGEARVVVRDGGLAVALVPETLNVPRLVRNAVARLLGLTFQLPPLPFDFEATSVAVTPAGVTVTAAARDVVLGPTPR